MLSLPFSFPSLSPSCSLLPLLLQHSAHLGREWTGWEGAAAARGKGRKGKITRRQMRFVEMDRNVERMSVGKWGKKELWSIKKRERGLTEVECWWIAQRGLRHPPPATCPEYIKQEQSHTPALYLSIVNICVCACVRACVRVHARACKPNPSGTSWVFLSLESC